MRFLADMGLSMHMVVWLRRQGYDTIHLLEEGLQHLSMEAGTIVSVYSGATIADCWVIKDAGNDPDIAHRAAEIKVTL